MSTQKTKVCTKCGVTKELEFYSKRAPHLLHSWCKQCQSDWAQSAYDPIKRKEYNLRKEYGISLSDYNQLKDAQQHRCKICNRHEDDCIKGELHVDHIVKDGRVYIRGLLCMFCNTALGKVGDDVDILKRMILYVEASR